MLENDGLFAKFGFDRTEIEPFQVRHAVSRRLPPRVTLECRIFYYSSLPSVLVSRSCGSLSHWSTAIPLFGLVCRAMQREGSTSCFRSPSCASWGRSRGNPTAALSAVAACCFPFVQQGNSEPSVLGCKYTLLNCDSTKILTQLSLVYFPI